jgi:(p)ppGpp synthase/HD superfamily hydrolase
MELGFTAHVSRDEPARFGTSEGWCRNDGKKAMTDIAQTLEYVKQLHRDHLDQLGRPYHTHLARVLAHVRRLFPDADEEVQHAALLHGSVEEKKTTLQALRGAGYSPNIVRMVEWNTRPRSPGAPPYLDWIRHLAECAPLGAIMIKIADNEDNNDPRRIARLPEEQRDVSDVYDAARRILEAAVHRRTKLEAPPARENGAILAGR